MATEFISNSWLMPTNANAEANRVSNYSLDFDGTSQFVDVGNLKPSTTALSISAWAYKTDTSNGSVIGRGASVDYGIFVFGGVLQFGIKTGSWSTISTTLPTLNQWFHVCATWDGTTMKLYVDGVEASSASKTGTINYTSNNTTIGKNSTLSGFEWDGKITEVSIFDYSLSSSQVTQLYGTGSAIGNPMAITNGRKPVAYYPLGNAGFNGEFLTPNSAEKDYVFQSDGSLGPVINLPSINLGTTNTVSFWYYNETQDTTQIPIGSSTNQFDYLVFISTGFSSVVNFTTYSIGNPQVALKFDNTDARNILTNTNTWIHIAFTRNGDSVSLYLNGSFNETLTGVGTTNDTILDTLISEADGVGSNSINGKMSNVSVFNTALPATGTESVESLYNYGTPPNIASWSNLQGWWELDASATFDGSNWSIPDASSNSNTGTSSGMTASNLVQSDLIINQSYDPFSLSFDGTDDFISTNLNVDNYTNLTYSVWINPASLDQRGGISDLSSSDNFGAYFWAGSGGQFYVNIGSSFSNIAGTWSLNKFGTLGQEKWLHLAIVYDGSGATDADRLKVYADGNYVAFNSVGSIPASIPSGGGDLVIGKLNTYEFEGEMSNLSIYNSALSATQVKTLYNEGKPFDLNTFEVTPVSWWRLGSVNSSFDGTNWTVLDEIGTNNGTSANMTQADLVDGVGATGSGTSSGMSSGTNRTGNSPYSENNAVSYSMSVLAKSTSVPT